MVPMGMVQMAVHQIIGVIAVRHGLVAASRPMPVIAIVTRTAMLGRAAVRVVCAHGDHVLVDMIVVRVVQVSVVEIVDVTVMSYGRMAAPWTMLMGMILVNRVIVGHWPLLARTGLRAGAHELSLSFAPVP